MSTDTHSTEWKRALDAEIRAQEALIERMRDNYPDMQGNGIMGQLRAERLELLERLLDFEPKEAVSTKAMLQGSAEGSHADKNG